MIPENPTYARTGVEAILQSGMDGFSKPVVARGCRFILGMRVDGTSYEEATGLIVRWAKHSESRYVIEVPVNAVMESYDHADFRQIVNGADLVTPGGMPIVWILRLLGLERQPRVYGPELTLHVCEAAARQHIPVGFYGADETTLKLLRKCLSERYPELPIVYCWSPPFRTLTQQEEEVIANDMRLSGCRILFVGLGCPKQERWMARHRGAVPAVMLGVGAAFDFISGRKAQAPAWMQAAGLEWAFRWATEPRRLFFRYAYHNPRFVVLMASQLLKAHWPSSRTACCNDTRVEPFSAKESGKTEEVIDVFSLERSLRLKRLQLGLKRGFDFAAALVGLTVLAPLLLVTGALVRCTSPGPALFKQHRIGRRGNQFVTYKFRTMQAQVDCAAEQLQAMAARAGSLVKGINDRRVTPLGRFLRSTSLDELPQLFNVLRGDMSLVGPRPLIPFMLSGHPEFAKARALVRPGITGLWQVHERENNTTVKAMMPYDLEYIRRFGVWLDLEILLRTPFVVISGIGAV